MKALVIIFIIVSVIVAGAMLVITIGDMINSSEDSGKDE